ncbi:MAG: hypothetical protein OIN89_07290 [Candidatus Methanoperedens sp.]|jgi:hypothetical protein|nr:hypothetical protein [Candidatus Methanoperedens sp.]PKL53587.1 MAG: hypothetical protein CVV36_06340 [Candidatus Methanoperedenaceae archaeon HGW-Methanoperedenaceae-1]
MTDDEKKYVGDEFVEEDETFVNEQEQELQGLYDLVLPPGLPQKVIIDAVEEFNLEVTTRKCDVKSQDIDEENLLVLRGKLDDVNNAQEFIYKKLKERFNYNG